jgi:hypothetical protein
MTTLSGDLTMRRWREFPTAWGKLLPVLLALFGGCSGDLIFNLTEERTGNISVVFINDTDYRASFTFGSFDDLSRDPAFTQVDVQQRRLESNSSTPPISLGCQRDFAVATQRFVRRVIAVDADQQPDFDQDAFTASVSFSDAPSDSPAAALPTVGTAEGRIVRLGVDYSCNDQLLFTFEQDPNAAGGFRIDFSVIPDIEDDR